MRNEPWWAGLEAMAPTLAYDSEVMGDISRGGTVPTHLVGGVTIPTLVLCGGASPACMIDVGRQVAETMPNGRLDILEDQEHVVAPEILVPVLAEFFRLRRRAELRRRARSISRAGDERPVFEPQPFTTS